jgi:hypothetical protein
MFTATLEFTMADEEAAKRLFRTLSTDNEGYVESKITGNRLISVVRSESLSTLRQTLDDLLACADLGEAILSKKVTKEPLNED